jgi:hypothetical protein
MIRHHDKMHSAPPGIRSFRNPDPSTNVDDMVGIGAEASLESNMGSFESSITGGGARFRVVHVEGDAGVKGVRPIKEEARHRHQEEEQPAKRFREDSMAYDRASEQSMREVPIINVNNSYGYHPILLPSTSWDRLDSIDHTSSVTQDTPTISREMVSNKSIYQYRS